MHMLDDHIVFQPPLQTCKAYSLTSKRLLLTQRSLVILLLCLRNEVEHAILEFVLGHEPQSRDQ